MAALDAEEQAAEVYAGLVGRADEAALEARGLQPDVHLGGPAGGAGHAPWPWPERRILLCDPESQSLHALRVVLQGAGFEVDATRTAAEAFDRGAVSPPAAAIIELVLPDGDGVEVCRRLREWSVMPVILLSAVRDEEAQVRAFDAGADDYVAKPFRPRELVARLLANLRRAEPGREEPCVELEGLQIDLAARVVRRRATEVHLTPIEFELLGVLIQSRGRLLTHNALLAAGLGHGVRRRPTDAARAHREPAPQDRARRRRPPHYTPTTASAIAWRMCIPGDATRRRPAEDVIDHDVVRNRISVASGPGAHMTTRVSGCGLRVA